MSLKHESQKVNVPFRSGSWNLVENGERIEGHLLEGRMVSLNTSFAQPKINLVNFLLSPQRLPPKCIICVKKSTLDYVLHKPVARSDETNITKQSALSLNTTHLVRTDTRW